jgi:hypothetical protein
MLSAAASNPGPQKPCFDKNGVEFSKLFAYLCEVKLGDNPSGALYFTPSIDDGLNTANPGGEMLWYKLHAAKGAYYVWENYSDPWGGSSPRSNARIIALDEGPAGQCVVMWPSWTVDPTQCFLVRDGGAVVEPPHNLTAIEKFSILQYQLNMRASVPLGYR